MFRVIVGTERNGQLSPLHVYIEGCPRSGIEAIDFRRRHGLPDAPTSEIDLPGFAFTDEALCRAHPERCDSSADICTENRSTGSVKEWCCNSSGVYESSTPRYACSQYYEGFYLYVQPLIICAYLEAQSPLTAKALLENIWGYTQRSKVRAEAEWANIQADKEAAARKLAEARELLKAELNERDRLRVQRDELEKQVELLQAEIDGKEEDDE